MNGDKNFRRHACLAALLALLSAAPAFADIPSTNASVTAGGLNFAVGPGSIAIVSPGTGYAAGDTVTMACAAYPTGTGVAVFTTSPVIGIGSVSGGVPTNVMVINTGVATQMMPAGCTLTQTATSGTGTGLTVSVNFGVIAAQLSLAGLSTGGGAANGNTFLGAETPSQTLAGAENSFFGDRAGGAFTGPATANSAFGHNACGIFGLVTPSGNWNTCLGNDAGRNISGAAAANTLVGQNAGRLTSGSFSTIIGEGAATAMTTGGANIVIGQSAAASLTTGTVNIVMGWGCDVPTATSTATITICSQGGKVWSLTGGATPSTSVTTIAGIMNAVGAYQSGGTPGLTCSGTPTASFASTLGIVTHC